MTQIATITELLKLSGSQYRVFDIGRKISKLSKETFNKVELNQIPYPFPAQGHAWVAIAFWQTQGQQPYIWFVKLPLDERSLLNQGARNHFIAIIIEALGSDLSVNPTEKQEELLKGNPYHFTPAGYKLSALNSVIKVELKQPASIHYEAVEMYLSGQCDWADWQGLGIQGIHDFAAKISENDNAKGLAKNLPHIPKEVLYPLCIALENQELPVDLINAFVETESTEQDEDTKVHLARALSSSIQHPNVKSLFKSIMNNSALSSDWIITISGRCWDLFTDQDLLSDYLELLATHEDPLLFPAIFKDLVAIPSIKPNIFVCMRKVERSDALAKAIGSLFNQQ